LYDYPTNTTHVKLTDHQAARHLRQLKKTHPAMSKRKRASNKGTNESKDPKKPKTEKDALIEFSCGEKNGRFQFKLEFVARPESKQDALSILKRLPGYMDWIRDEAKHIATQHGVDTIKDSKESTPTQFNVFAMVTGNGHLVVNCIPSESKKLLNLVSTLESVLEDRRYVYSKNHSMDEISKWIKDGTWSNKIRHAATTHDLTVFQEQDLPSTEQIDDYLEELSKRLDMDDYLTILDYDSKAEPQFLYLASGKPVVSNPQTLAELFAAACVCVGPLRSKEP